MPLQPITADVPTLDVLRAALQSASSDHLPRLVDVSAHTARASLLVEGADGPTLRELLGWRGGLTQAEAVTVAIGVARGIRALHAAGFSGTDAWAVRFTADARPVLFGLESVRRGSAAAAADWTSYEGLARRLGCADPAFGPRAVDVGLAIAAMSASESAAAFARLETALFTLAEPEPVELKSFVPAGPRLPLAPPPAAAVTTPAEPRSRLAELFEAGPAAVLRGVRERARAVAEGRGRPIAIGLALAAVLAVAALLVAPQPESSGAQRAPSAGAGAAAELARPSVTASAAPSVTAAALPADPVDAAPALLAARDACLAGPRADRDTCLAAVADSPSSDLTTPDMSLGGYRASLIERVGDSALVALTPPSGEKKPASALLMKTEVGWRLRQLFAS